ncbi:hypothetical protein Ahy_A05g023483 [Arachis hypogaea]|uniref:Uncharacterized protein n=1 Tax=Arachis hypogaea TaxID=3818 RepID=A0A445D413_ARAHY|nr:hypothetical protein Ahy_A05g023483 [Arachis hypogaea]
MDNITAWVSFLGLAIEYYEEEVLKKIGNILRRTMKVDTNTAQKSRRKFARLCVELDLTFPLIIVKKEKKWQLKEREATEDKRGLIVRVRRAKMKTQI